MSHPNGFAMLGDLLAGGGQRRAADAYTQQMAAQMGVATREQQLLKLMDEAKQRQAISVARAALPAQLEASGVANPQLLGALMDADLGNWAQLNQGEGYRQAQGFRQGAVDAALTGDYNAANANLFGVATGPQQLATVQGDLLLGNRFVEGGDAQGLTALGQAKVGAQNAQAAAANALAANRRDGRSGSGKPTLIKTPQGYFQMGAEGPAPLMYGDTHLQPTQAGLSTDDYVRRVILNRKAQIIADTAMGESEKALAIKALDDFGAQVAPPAPTAPGAAAPGGVPMPTTQAEYDALPSGALFVDPDDGKTYRKP